MVLNDFLNFPKNFPPKNEYWVFIFKVVKVFSKMEMDAGQKIQLEVARTLAAANGYRLTSNIYFSATVKMYWQCLFCERDPLHLSLKEMRAKIRCNPCACINNKDKTKKRKVDFVYCQELAAKYNCKLVTPKTSFRKGMSKIKLEWECDTHGILKDKRSPDSIHATNFICHLCNGTECKSTKEIKFDQILEKAAKLNVKILMPEGFQFLGLNHTRINVECLECNVVTENITTHALWHNDVSCKPCKKRKCILAKMRTIEDVHEYCASRIPVDWSTPGKDIPKEKRPLKCNSMLYHNGLLEFECLAIDCVHTWDARFSQIKNRESGCRVCSGSQKLTIEDAQKAAAKRNGICLSTEYIDSITKLKFKCENPNHEPFNQTLVAIRHNNNWCPLCGNEKKGQTTKLQIDEYHKLAEKRGFTFESEEVPQNTHSNGLWKCNKNKPYKKQHVWPATYSNICYGETGCPTCVSKSNQSKIEKATKKWLKAKGFGFDKQKKFIDLIDTRQLSYDFFICDVLIEGYGLISVLIECDGRQHYFPVEYWGGQEKFQKQTYHDDLKTQYCVDNNIHLLRVNYKDNVEEKLTELFARLFACIQKDEYLIMAIGDS